jgi:preprotein translocase subunit YajC
MTITGQPLALLLAQAAPAAASGGPSSFIPIVVQFALIIGIIYFVMFRPQQKQRQKHETALKGLKRGDDIVTVGGIIGTVIHIAEASKDGGANRLDDRVTIKSGESRLVVERARIARINGTASAAPASTSTTSPAE